MKGHTVIIFNDVVVANTDKIVSYEKEYDDQKEYRFTNIKNELTAVIFCEDLNIVPNENILVEIL
jgi:hypothetical protein